MLKVSKVVLSLFVVSSIALANPSKDMNSLDISKNDKEFLFGTNNANIVALNDVEMKDTDGKWLPAIFALSAFLGRYQYANAPRISDNYAYYRDIGVRKSWNAKTYKVRIK